MESYTRQTFEAIFSSLTIISLRSIQVIVCINGLLLFVGEQYSMVWMQYCSFNHLLIERHLSCFYSLPTTNRAVMPFMYNVRVNINFHLSGVIAGSYSKCVFSFKRNCQTIVLNGYDVLHSPQRLELSLHIFLFQSFLQICCDISWWF